jgi:tetratricopeptide (TPR) repeat protein
MVRSVPGGGEAIRALFHGSRTAALVCLAALATLSACDEQQIAHCDNTNQRFAPDLVIAGCTALIQSGHLATKELATTFNNRGVAYGDQRDYARAIADYDQAIRLNPQDALAYSNRGFAYYNQQDYARAIADHHQAIRLNPGDALAYNNRGFAYFSQRNYARAIADYDRAIRLNPELADAYVNRGRAYERLGDHARAAADRAAAARLSSR